MQERKGKKRRRLKTGWRITFELSIIVGAILLSTAMCRGSSHYEEQTESIAPIVTEISVETTDPTQEPVSTIEVTEAPIWREYDPNNGVYPYSMMSTDWIDDIYEEGFTYYQIPYSYTIEGGMFPEVAQAYLWSICKEAGVNYYIVLALIERESGYRYYATGDSGRSKGLMQVQEQYHIERMDALGVEDLYNPYSNMRVGVNYLKEIQDNYLDSSGEHCVLMVYNMGYYGASELWAEDVYSTAYTEQILQRAEEIQQELQEQ